MENEKVKMEGNIRERSERDGTVHFCRTGIMSFLILDIHREKCGIISSNLTTL